jgi:hypothetical protein
MVVYKTRLSNMSSKKIQITFPLLQPKARPIPTPNVGQRPTSQLVNHLSWAVNRPQPIPERMPKSVYNSFFTKVNL